MLVKFVLIASLAAIIGRASAMPTNNPVRHPGYTKELSAQEVIDKLNEIDFRKVENPTMRVMSIIYRAINKDAPLIGGVTISQVIALDEIELKDCSEESLKERYAFARQLKTSPHEPGLKYAMRVYLLDNLYAATRFCILNKEKVINKLINTKRFIKHLEEAYSADGFHMESRYDGPTQKYKTQELAWNGELLTSNVENYLGDGLTPSKTM